MRHSDKNEPLPVRGLNARTVLRKEGLLPKKSFGQNFLINERVILAIAEACIKNDERDRSMVIEIGSGLGALTSALLERASKVVAIERDRDLVPILRNLFSDWIAR